MFFLKILLFVYSQFLKGGRSGGPIKKTGFSDRAGFETLFNFTEESVDSLLRGMLVTAAASAQESNGKVVQLFVANFTGWLGALVDLCRELSMGRGC